MSFFHLSLNIVPRLRCTFFLNQIATPEDKLGTTCDRPDNKYACKSWLKIFPNGQRLDYIMYAANRGKKRFN